MLSPYSTTELPIPSQPLPNFLRNCHCFAKWMWHFTFPQHREGYSFFTLFPILAVVSLIVDILVSVKCISFVILIGISLMTVMSKCLFIPLLAVYLFWRNVYSSLLPTFLCCLYYSYNSFILDVSPFSDS
jgi:hypothetical protein